MGDLTRQILLILTETEKPGALVGSDTICSNLGITYDEFATAVERMERHGLVFTYETTGSRPLNSIGITDVGFRSLGRLP